MINYSLAFQHQRYHQASAITVFWWSAVTLSCEGEKHFFFNFTLKGHRNKGRGDASLPFDDHFRKWKVKRGSVDRVKIQLFTASENLFIPLFSLIPKHILFSFCPVSIHSLLSSFYMVSSCSFSVSRCPCIHSSLRLSLPHRRRSFLLPQPLFLSLSPVEEVPGQYNWYSGSVRASAEPC